MGKLLSNLMEILFFQTKIRYAFCSEVHVKLTEVVD